MQKSSASFNEMQAIENRLAFKKSLSNLGLDFEDAKNTFEKVWL